MRDIFVFVDEQSYNVLDTKYHTLINLTAYINLWLFVKYFPSKKAKDKFTNLQSFDQEILKDLDMFFGEKIEIPEIIDNTVVDLEIETFRNMWIFKHKFFLEILKFLYERHWHKTLNLIELNKDVRNWQVDIIYHPTHHKNTKLPKRFERRKRVFDMIAEKFWEENIVQSYMNDGDSTFLFEGRQYQEKEFLLEFQWNEAWIKEFGNAGKLLKRLYLYNRRKNISANMDNLVRELENKDLQITPKTQHTFYWEYALRCVDSFANLIEWILSIPGKNLNIVNTCSLIHKDDIQELRANVTLPKSFHIKNWVIRKRKKETKK